MKTKIYLVLFLALSNINVIKAQNSVLKNQLDSLLRIANHDDQQIVGSTFKRIDQIINDNLDNDEIESVFLQTLNELDSRTSSLEFHGYWRLSDIAYKKQKIQKSIDYAHRMLNYSDNEPKKLITAYNLLSHKFLYVNQVDSTLYYANLIEKAAKNGAIEMLWTAYSERAEVYKIHNEQEKLLNEYDKLLDYFRAYPDHPQKGYALFLMVEYFYLRNDTENFNRYSTDFFKHFENKPVEIGKNHMMVEYILYQDGVASAIDRLEESLNEERVKLLEKGYTIRTLAKAYGKNNEAEKGIDLLNNYIKQDNTKTSLDKMATNYAILGNLYELKGDYLNANLSLRKHLEHHKNWLAQLQYQEFAKFEVAFDTERKEQDLAMSELNLQKANQTKWLLVTGLVAAAIILLLLFRLFRINKKSKKKLQEKNIIISNALEEKEVLLREIHHRVKNNLQVISSLLNLQSRQLKDLSAKEAMQEGRNRVQSMALIHQNLYQEENLVGVNTQDYFTKLINTLISNYKLSNQDINVNNDIDELQLDVDIMIPLGLITNELISNALKHAFDDKLQGQIDLSLKKSGQALTLEISDNGKGLPDSFSTESHESLGYRLVQSFANKLNASLKVDRLSPGTRIMLHIPYLQAA